MQLVDHTVEFYMGAATTGEDPAKWSWPSRDLPYLYQRRVTHNVETPLDPPLEVWKEYGLVKAYGKDTDWRLISFREFLAHFGEARVENLLRFSRATYLKESKDSHLDGLGCPRITAIAKPDVTMVSPLTRNLGR